MAERQLDRRGSDVERVAADGEPPAAGSRPPFLARLRGRAGDLPLGALPVVALVVLWWALTATVLQQERIYPPPPLVVEELLRILSGEGPVGSPYAHMGATMLRLVSSFALAFVGGTLLGILAGRKKWVFDFLDNLVWIAMAVPSVVWVFIFLIVFGISDVVPITALVLLLGAPVFIGTAEGVKSVPPDLITMANSYRAGTPQRLFSLYLPSIAPYMAANARVAFSLGIKIIIIAEVVGLPNGIGLLVRYWSDRLFMAPVVAWGLLLMALGLAVDRLLFAPLERRTRQWSGNADAATVRVE